MGLLSSLLNLAIVVGAGWFTIYYLIPKLEGAPPPSANEGSGAETEQIPQDITDAVLGDEPGTTEALPDEPPKEEKKKKKAPYDPSKGMAGKGESKKKRSKKDSEKAKTEARIIEYLLEDNYGIY